MILYAESGQGHEKTLLVGKSNSANLGYWHTVHDTCMMLERTRRTSICTIDYMHHLLAQSTAKARGWVRRHEFTVTVVGGMWVEYCA